MILDAERSSTAASSSGQAPIVTPGTPLAPADPQSFFGDDDPARQNLAQKMANLDKQKHFSLPQGDPTAEICLTA
eukprot:5671174-Karenia_brevis.AAC.1